MSLKSTINNLEQFRKDIESDAQKYAINIAKYMAQNIADEMTEVAHNAIEDFYNKYDPEDPSKHNGYIYYYRHWNFKKSYKRYYKNRNPYFSGGIQLLHNDLPNVYTGTNSSPEAVFDRVYLGYHGIASLQNCTPPVPILKPSPIKRINEKFRYIQQHLKEYEDKAAEQARKDTYNYIF